MTETSKRLSKLGGNPYDVYRLYLKSPLMQSGMIHSKFPCLNSYSTSDVIGVQEDSDSYVFKKFINAAIYVEKSIKKLGSDPTSYSENMRIKKTKRCTCSTDTDSCYFHSSLASGDGIKYTKSDIQLGSNKDADNQHWNNTSKNKLKEIRERQRVINTRRIVSACSIPNNDPQSETKKDRDKYFNLELENLEQEILPTSTHSQNVSKDKNNYECRRRPWRKGPIQNKVDAPHTPDKPPECYKIDVTNEFEGHDSNCSSPSSSTLTGSTVRRVDVAPKNNTKMTLSSMTSCTLSDNETVKQWLMRKIEEQKQRKATQLSEKRRKEEERQKILEKERENFKLWLAEKRKVEEQQRALFEKQQQQLEKIRKEQLEWKESQNQAEFDRWLKKKNSMKMERENLEQMRAMQKKIDEERRLALNEAAFQEWVKSAKNKPMPVPLNKGLDSLRSSVSVTYINPVPWVPNIEQKPASK